MIKHILATAAAVGGLAIAAWAASPQMRPGVKIMGGNEPLDDHRLGHFVPAVADFNGDGKKDLIIGMFTGEPGNVWICLNVGTDAEPKFDKPKYLEAGGQPIKLSGG